MGAAQRAFSRAGSQGIGNGEERGPLRGARTGAADLEPSTLPLGFDGVIHREAAIGIAVVGNVGNTTFGVRVVGHPICRLVQRLCFVRAYPTSTPAPGGLDVFAGGVDLECCAANGNNIRRSRGIFTAITAIAGGCRECHATSGEVKIVR